MTTTTERTAKTLADIASEDGIFSIIAMAVLLSVLVATIEYLTAAGAAVNAVILAVVPLVLIAGAVYALVLRARKPLIFARVGGQEVEQA